MIRFIHTADWQLGKPFGFLPDTAQRNRLQAFRIQALRNLGEKARENRADFILVAGDLFDSPTPAKSVVSEACAAIGQMGVPVYAIPGNHDHGGPSGLWDNPHFVAESEKLCPNFKVLLAPAPVTVPGKALILPCPLLRRHESRDTSVWLRTPPAAEPDLPRIVLAHGSMQGFGTEVDAANNIVDVHALQRLTQDGRPAYEYIALGDWHGHITIGERAAYSGTHEPDRFPKGEDYRAGQALLVEIEARGAKPRISVIPTGCARWRTDTFHIADDADIEALERKYSDAGAVGTTLLQLAITGQLGLDADARLDEFLKLIQSRFIHLEVDRQTTMRPSDAEIAALRDIPDAPATSQVVAILADKAASASPDEARAAHVALRLLHASIHKQPARAEQDA